MPSAKVNHGGHGTRRPQNICVIIQKTTQYAIVADESAFIRLVDGGNLIVHIALIDTKLAERRRYCKTFMTILDVYLRT